MNGCMKENTQTKMNQPCNQGIFQAVGLLVKKITVEKDN